LRGERAANEHRRKGGEKQSAKSVEASEHHFVVAAASALPLRGAFLAHS